MKIGYIAGFWSTNIGNSFYNIGMMSLLKKVSNANNIHFIPDPPQVNWKNLKGDYSIISKLDIDLYVLSGPILGYEIKNIYSDIFKQIKQKGGKIAFISSGAVNYNEAEANFVANFLNEYDVPFVFTRDRQTYELYKDKLDAEVYDGLCTSMYLNDAIDPPDLNDEYVVTNFPFWHEPVIKNVNNKWQIKQSILKSQNKINGLPVVRLQSKGIIPNSRFLRTEKFLYTRKNMYYSDLPYGYLSILKSAKNIFSDRVHTCAAGLILGSRCMYIKGQRRSKDGRNNIFHRLRLSNIFKEPAALDMSYIDAEKKLMTSHLTDILKAIK